MESKDEIGKWQFRKWFARPALIDKKSGSSRLYVGQRFEPNYFDLVEDGWIHDHCDICFRVICSVKNKDSDDAGFFNGDDWICESCFNKLKDSQEK